MKRISETGLLTSVNSLRELMKIVNEDSWNVHGVSPFDDQTRSIQATKDRIKKGPLAATGPSDAPDLANSILNAPKTPNIFPTPNMHQFQPSDTSYAQDHPPVDDLGGPSDLDKAIPKQLTPTAAKQHPAGLPKSAKPKFDPAIQKLQYELRAKGYPVRTDGILDAKTKQASDWEKMSQEREHAISDYPALQATMDEPVTAPQAAPIENPQGEFDRMPELNEHVTFSNDDSLARIIQLARGQ